MSSKKITLYKYMGLKRALDAVETGRLYLSDGTNFNDPFELSITDRNTGEIKHIENLHILCLTGGFQNKLIWSHYASSHKGVCLTIEFNSRQIYPYIRPVFYTTSRVYFDSNLDDLLNAKKRSSKKNISTDYSALSDKKKIAYLKDAKWDYEREYRVVFDECDEHLLESDGRNWYLPVTITNVYFGVNYYKQKNDDRCTAHRLLNLCEKNNITIKMMQLSTKNYSVYSPSDKKANETCRVFGWKL